mgnify:CR=1 FL=1
MTYGTATAYSYDSCYSCSRNYDNSSDYYGGGCGSFLNITFGDLGLDTSSYNGYYFDIITQSQSFQISASTSDRSDTLTATINTVGLTWN